MRSFAAIATLVLVIGLAGCGKQGSATKLGEPYDSAYAAMRQGDDPKAVKLLMPAAQQGSARAQALLGFIYDSRAGGLHNESLAFKWISRAAKSGDAHSQMTLGEMYEDGRGVAKDEAKALQWYQRAAKAGDKDAQRVLSDVYAYGRLGQAPDPKKAQYWMLRADRK